MNLICMLVVCMLYALYRIDDQVAEVEEKNKEERLKQLWDSFKQSTK